MADNQEQANKNSNDTSGPTESPGKEAMNSSVISALMFYMFFVIIIIVWVLVSLWPPVREKDKKIAENANAAVAAQNQNGNTAATTANTAQNQNGNTAAGNRNIATNQNTATATNSNANTAGNNNAPSNSNTGANANSVTNGNTGTVAGSNANRASNTNQGGNSNQDECAAKKRIKDEYCLDEDNKIRPGIGSVKIPLIWCGCMYDEDRLLLIVLLAGALGSLVHGIRSLSWYVGNRRAVSSWSAYYLALPFMGAGYALIFYFIIRGGFFSPTSSVADTSPFGFAAVAALIGLFTEQAVQKLRSVSETILSPAEKGSDHIDSPKITDIKPGVGPTKGGNSVIISGEDFSTGAKVTFGGAGATVTASDSKTIMVLAPPHAAGIVDVVVINKDGQKAVKEKGYEYKDEPEGQQPQPNTAPSLTITRVEPNTGPTGGETEVKITGTGFVAGAGVNFGGVPATNVALTSDTILTAQTPPHATGTVDVEVINPGDKKALLKNGFTYKD